MKSNRRGRARTARDYNGSQAENQAPRAVPAPKKKKAADREKRTGGSVLTGARFGAYSSMKLLTTSLGAGPYLSSSMDELARPFVSPRRADE